MKLLLDEHRERMLANGRFNLTLRAQGKDEFNFAPVVKLFCPRGAATWLLSEIDPEDEDIAFGLCTSNICAPRVKADQAHSLMVLEAGV